MRNFTFSFYEHHEGVTVTTEQALRHLTFLNGGIFNYSRIEDYYSLEDLSKFVCYCDAQSLRRHDTTSAFLLPVPALLVRKRVNTRCYLYINIYSLIVSLCLPSPAFQHLYCLLLDILIQPLNMAQIPQIKEYRAKPSDKFPFHKSVTKGKKLKGPSSSKWKLSQLQWLGIDHQIECTLQDIVPTMTLARKVHNYIHENLSMPLDDVMKQSSKGSKHDFYASLRQLLTVRPEPRPYDKSSSYERSSQPPDIRE